jgi:hypothetical protein
VTDGNTPGWLAAWREHEFEPLTPGPSRTAVEVQDYWNGLYEVGTPVEPTVGSN